MEGPRSSSSFGTFLNTVQQSSQPNAPAQASAGAIPASLLTPLAERPMAVQDLMVTSGMGVIEFADALKRMQDAEFVEIRRKGDREFANLTPAGARLAGVLAGS